MIYSFQNISPRISDSAFIAPGAIIIGDVEIADHSSIWFNVIIRGDVHFIRIGHGTNIQDNAMLHVTSETHPLQIGSGVTIAHHVVLHGCTVADNSLIGMGAIILDGVKISENTVVAAGSLVREKKEFPPGVLVAGFPAEIKRELTAEEIEKNRVYARNYMNYKNQYMDPGIFRPIVEDQK